ncbi:MAG: CHAT domain-containing protein, partial [Anaerolineae bacterium]|nr:CHAT domain-containing protein [Anaerolineae bacterium]
IELADAAWTAVQGAFPAETSARLILTQDGQPAWVLARKKGQVMRSADTKGVTRGVGSLADFVDQYAASPEAVDGGRVVNTWFADGRQAPVAPTRALAANTLYHFAVNIGAPDSRGNVEGKQPEVPSRVIAALVASGEQVIFRLDSEDFLLLEREKSISLSQTRTTPELYFRLVTPVQTGLCRLRLGVYVRENLIQSYQVFAHVAPMEGEIPEKAVEGWWSKCEYTLSADLSNLDALEQRRVCIWVGDGRSATQRAGLSGEGFDLGQLPAINVQLIGKAFEEYREVLYSSCYIELKNAAGKVERVDYLYDANAHTPLNNNTFTEGLKTLAEDGQMLYQHLFGDQCETLGKTLQSLEQGQDSPLVLQIARLNLDMTFPWAMLYDRPFRFHPGRNRVCEHFVNGEGCRANCPHKDDPYIVCPYGFWGFRYIIEQPLRPPNEYTSVITALPGDSPQLHLTFGPDLGLTPAHAQIVQTIVGSRQSTMYGDRNVNSAAQNTDALIEAFGRGMTLAYFYCHGGNKGTRQWLQVGAGDPLFPAYLKDDLRATWQASGTAPLVVLNGCHTAKYTPETFLSFVHRFGALGAAGVIGTEVPIHEHLGKYFGEFFMQRFLNGDPIGRIIYDFRCDLLKRKNFLGLIYVPYCYATLHLERGGKG